MGELGCRCVRVLDGTTLWGELGRSLALWLISCILDFFVRRYYSGVIGASGPISSLFVVGLPSKLVHYNDAGPYSNEARFRSEAARGSVAVEQFMYENPLYIQKFRDFVSAAVA